MAYSGTIARKKATLRRDDADRLFLDWRERCFDLTECVVRHRDEDGDVEFSITTVDDTVLGARYRRKGRSLRDTAMDLMDFTADEPWSWEDGDFGLLVFHEATGTGPVKYRHRFQPTHVDPVEFERHSSLTISDSGLLRTRHLGRREEIAFKDLMEVRVKFEVAGIWAPSSVLVLSTAHDLAVFPLSTGDSDVSRCRTELLPRLRRLANWSEASDVAVEDACEYATRKVVGPTKGESLDSRAERPVWRRGAS